MQSTLANVKCSQSLCFLCLRGVLDLSPDLDRRLRRKSSCWGPGLRYQIPTVMEELERYHIRKTLEHTRWVVAGAKGAAARLGINRSTLYFRMKKLGIVRSQRRGSQRSGIKE